LVDALLEVASIGLVVSAGLASLDSLRLNEHGLATLLIACVVLLEDTILVGLDHLDAGLLQCLANQHLEDWLHLKAVIEKIGVVIHHLDCLIVTLLVGDVSRRWLKRRRKGVRNIYTEDPTGGRMRYHLQVCRYNNLARCGSRRSCCSDHRVPTSRAWAAFASVVAGTCPASAAVGSSARRSRPYRPFVTAFPTFDPVIKQSRG
jgi:hypothetical protein